MKKNGFTLVELLAVIILLGLLMAIAVPNALKLNNKVNRRGYETKIDMIEQAADSYGQSNLALVRKGASPLDTSKSYTCKFTYTGNEINSVTLSQKTYTTAALAADTYWCFRVTVADLVNASDLSWDSTNQCEGKCTTANKQYYDNQVINPASKGIINQCYVYIYYKNSRVYSHFDTKTCDNIATTPTAGREYTQLKK